MRMRCAVGVGAVGIISTMMLHTVPLWKLHVYPVHLPLSDMLSRADSLVQQYPRMQWSFLPYTQDVTMTIREDVGLDTPIYPTDPDGGCWSNTHSTYSTPEGCTDWSYKAMTDSYLHYSERSLYTEMEMMVPVEYTVQAMQDYIVYMDTIRDQHDPSVYVSVMVRYVAGDDMYLSPMYNRTTSVFSIIVLGDQYTTGSSTEFHLFASGLQQILQEKYFGRPHWGKVNYILDPNVNYIAMHYNTTLPLFQEVMKKMDPNGMFRNNYINERLL